MPDETKWDTIYALPFFAKPGKHTYVIKYKNTEEKYQKKSIKRKERLQKNFERVRDDAYREEI
jgi:hypothetical protein